MYLTNRQKDHNQKNMQLNKKSMKYLKFIGLSFLIIFITACKNNEEILQGDFKFRTQYSATVTVGGFVGIIERTFEIGEIYEGTDDGGETIAIRIAEHSELNKDCPNSWCYQEFLEVPREYLIFDQKKSSLTK